MSTLSPRACGPQDLGVHIRQITRACVTTVTSGTANLTFGNLYSSFCIINLLIFYLLEAILYTARAWFQIKGDDPTSSLAFA